MEEFPPEIVAAAEALGLTPPHPSITAAALAVAEAAFDARERHEPRGCPTPGACSCLRSEAAIRADEREACAKVAETIFPPIHTWGSENSDRYHVQDETCQRIAAAIRARGGEDGIA